MNKYVSTFFPFFIVLAMINVSNAYSKQRQYIQCSRSTGHESLVINLEEQNNNLRFHSGKNRSENITPQRPQKIYLISSTGRYITYSNNQSPIQETVKIPTKSYGIKSTGFEVVYERFNIAKDIISETTFICFSNLLSQFSFNQ